MDIEQATKQWAADKVGCKPEQVQHVEFETEAGYGGCETCGYGGTPARVYMAVTGGSMYREVDIPDMDFMTIIREISAYVQHG